VIVQLFKLLAEIKLGEFKAGRRGFSSRFEWDSQLITVGQVASGEAEHVETVTPEDTREDVAVSLKHVMNLRPDYTVTLELPQNITHVELSRLVQFMRSIPFEERRTER
jgi:hypothetical protein